MQTAKAPFHVMVKPRGPVCNLACEYCYYLPKVDLYPGSNFHMSDALLADFIRQMFAAQPGEQVEFSWQGGEPTLMGLDFFRRTVTLQQEFCPPGTQVRNAIQTNGTLINPSWCRFFKQHQFLVGLSLDGPPEVHNPFRTNRSGRERYQEVMRAAELLRQNNVDFNILCCVHQANAAHPLEVYRFLRDKVGAQFIQFIPIIQRELDEDGSETEAITNRSVSGPAYGEFLKAVFDEWVTQDVGKVFVQLFDVALGVWYRQEASLCVFSETCGRAMVLEHNGDLYACDHFVTPHHRLGNITNTPLVALVESAQQRQFGEDKRDKISQVCLACPVRFICQGGCPKNRDANGLNVLCAGYQAFFEHIDPAMTIMADLIRSQQAPAEIMSIEYPGRPQTSSE